MNRDEFIAVALRNPANKFIVDELFHLALPDAWLVSGCLVQTAWNVLTGRAVDHGIADYDIFYFDRDTSWQAEDDVIRRLDAMFDKLRVKIEARNQARVHLWYPAKFGLPYPQLMSACDGVDQFLVQASVVAVRQPAANALDIYAPLGLDDIFTRTLRPNPLWKGQPRKEYHAKCERYLKHWPSLRMV